MRRLILAVAALLLLRADMYQDMSNAVGGKRVGTFYAPAYGNCTWDATHDVGACINAAIEAAYVQGGGTVALPAGTYGVSTPIATNRNHIGIGCNTPSGSRAASDPYNVPPPAELVGGCELKWIGTAGGRMMSFAAPNDSQFLVGAKVENIRFNGNNGLAADGLYLRSSHGGEFNNLRFVGGFTGGNVIHLDVTPGDHPVPHGSQWNHFTDTDIINHKYTSNGVKLGFYQSANPGSIGANASLNTFDQLHIYTGNGAVGKAIWCWGCDNNRFNMAYVGVDTGGIAIDLDIYTDNGRWFPANANIFDHTGYQPGAIARGKATYPTCVAFGFPSLGTCTWGNEFRKIDGSNGTPAPVVEVGAYVKYGYDYGIEVNAGGAFIASDGTRAAQTLMGNPGGLHACGNDSMTYAPGAGTHYCFGTEQVAQLYSNASTVVGQQDHFLVGFGGTPGALDLRWTHPLGTGKYHFADGQVQFDRSAQVGIGPDCMTLGVAGSLCLSNYGQTGLELYDGTAHWLLRQNPSHEFEIFQPGGAIALTVAYSGGWPVTKFGGPVAVGTGTLVANLPACNAAMKYSLLAVSDQSGVPTYRGTLTGGGTIPVLAFCNGTSWEAH